MHMGLVTEPVSCLPVSPSLALTGTALSPGSELTWCLCAPQQLSPGVTMHLWKGRMHLLLLAGFKTNLHLSAFKS